MGYAPAPVGYTSQYWRGQIYYNLDEVASYTFKEKCDIVLGRSQKHLSLRNISAEDAGAVNKLLEEHVQRVEAHTGLSAVRMPIKGSLYVKMDERFVWWALDGLPGVVPFGLVWGKPTLNLRAARFGNNSYHGIFLVREVAQVKAPEQAAAAANKQPSSSDTSTAAGTAWTEPHEWAPRAGDKWLHCPPEELDAYTTSYV